MSGYLDYVRQDCEHRVTLSATDGSRVCVYCWETVDDRG